MKIVQQPTIMPSLGIDQERIPCIYNQERGGVLHIMSYDIIRQATIAATTTKRRSIQRMKVLTQFLYNCILAFLMHGNGGSNTGIILTKEYQFIFHCSGTSKFTSLCTALKSLCTVLELGECTCKKKNIQDLGFVVCWLVACS